MYRRSCGRTAERIDASRRPRIDFLVVKLTSGLRTTSSPPVLPESQAVGRGVPPYSETRRTCPRMACAGPQPTGRRAILPSPCGLDGPPPRQHFKPPRQSRIFSSVETNYRFRKLIHSATIANWHVFFSGLALALETSSESLLPSEGNRSGKG